MKLSIISHFYHWWILIYSGYSSNNLKNELSDSDNAQTGISEHKN